MLLRRLSLSPARHFSTKGHKKTRRLAAIRREAQRKAPPKLPWWIHKEEPEWLKKFCQNKELLEEIFYAVQMGVKELMREPSYRPIEQQIADLQKIRLDAVRRKFEEKYYPKFLRQFQQIYLDFTDSPEERDLRIQRHERKVFENPLVKSRITLANIQDLVASPEPESNVTSDLAQNNTSPGENTSASRNIYFESGFSQFVPSGVSRLGQEFQLRAKSTPRGEKREAFGEKRSRKTPSELLQSGEYLAIKYDDGNSEDIFASVAREVIAFAMVIEKEKEMIRDNLSVTHGSTSAVSIMEEKVPFGLVSVAPSIQDEFLELLRDFTHETPVTAEIERYTRLAVDRAWKNYYKSTGDDKSEDLLEMLRYMDEHKLRVSGELAMRMVHSLMREDKVEEAWDLFREMTNMRNIWTPALIETGINLCGMRDRPERALQYFEMGERMFGKSYVALFLHPLMEACSGSRGMTQYAFNAYDEMTKFHFLKPNERTLRIMLKACSVLGDVERAQDLWKEMTVKFNVKPDESCVVTMLRCYANGNRMLRARTLRKEMVKVLSMEDKALLAQAAGFTTPKIDRTDEVRRVLRELDYEDPRGLNGDYSDPVERLLQKRRREKQEGAMGMLEETIEEEERDIRRINRDDDDDVGPRKLTIDQQIRRENVDTRGFAAKVRENVMNLMRDSEARNVERSVALLSSIDSGDEVISASEKNQSPSDTVVSASDGSSVKATGEPNSSKVETALAVSPQAGPAAPKTATTLAVRNQGFSNGQRQEDNIAAAVEFASSMQTTMGLEKPTLAIQNALLAVVSSALRLKRAEDVFANIRASGHQPDLRSYNTMIAMYSRAGRVAKAQEYFDKAVEEFDQVDKLTVGPMIDCLARSGKHADAVALFKKYDHLKIMEKHIRYLRTRVRGTELESQVPPDPNYWRSRENIIKQVTSLPSKGPGRKQLDWLEGAVRE